MAWQHNDHSPDNRSRTDLLQRTDLIGCCSKRHTSIWTEGATSPHPFYLFYPLLPPSPKNRASNSATLNAPFPREVNLDEPNANGRHTAREKRKKCVLRL